VPAAKPAPSDGIVHECVTGEDWVLYEPSRKDQFPHHARTAFCLPVEDAEALYLFSRGSQQAGTVQVVNSDKPGSSAEVIVTVGYYTQFALDHATVCHLERAQNERGIGILTPKWWPSQQDKHNTLQFHVKVILPASKDNDVLQVKRFETDMPLYVHTFGNLAEFATFRHMSLKTADAPITAESIHVDESYMQTSNASINGVFGASSSLKFRSANGPITAIVDLLNQGSEPTILDIETSNSPINCAVSLAASDNGPGAGGTFDVRTITSNSPLKISFKSLPTGAKLQTIARTSNSRATIDMHPEFEGSFQAETSRFGQADLEMLNVVDPTGKGRKRIFQDVRKEKGSARGSVFWQREMADNYDVRRRGRVEVKTSNGPIRLLL